MPRVKRFEELPRWLKHRLEADWATLHGGPTPNHPPIRDPEYRVYRVDDEHGVATGWWSVDAGTGGVEVVKEGESHAYDDLVEGPLKRMVDAEGRRCRDAEHVEVLCGIIRSHGVDASQLGRLVILLREAGPTDERVVRELVGLLYDGLTYGNWLIG